MSDVSVKDEGSVVLFFIHSEAAKEWVGEKMHLESWQWMGKVAFAVDRRFAGDLIEGMSFDGLEVEL